MDGIANVLEKHNASDITVKALKGKVNYSGHVIVLLERILRLNVSCKL
jgi:hypothetical protein